MQQGIYMYEYIKLIYILCFLAIQLKSFELTSPLSSYKLSPGGVLTLQFDFTFDNGNSSTANKTVLFKGEITPVQLDTSTAVIDDTGQRISFALSADNFNLLGFGNHNCIFHLSTNSSDKISINILVSYEEPITNLQVSPIKG